MALTAQTHHTFHVDSKAPNVWAFFWHVPGMAACIPGCEEVTTIQEHESYRVQVRRNMGPFLIRIPLDIYVIESVVPRSIRIEVSGRDKRLRSEVSQAIAVSLKATDDGGTNVDLDVHVALNGILAKLGEHLVMSQIEQMLHEFFAALRGAIAERGAAA